jgi:hypothetical protein
MGSIRLELAGKIVRPNAFPILHGILVARFSDVALGIEPHTDSCNKMNKTFTFEERHG